MKLSKISVIIPAHNEEEVIERAIKSVLDQSYQNFEIIVVNDGSTDKTKEIIEKLIKGDKRIKTRNFGRGHSAAFARNRGAEKASGDVLVFLDADSYVNDIFLKEIAKNYGKADAFITINTPLKEKFISRALSGLIGPSLKIKLEDGTIYDKNNHAEAGSMFFCITKKAFKKIKAYNENIFYYEDEDFSEKFWKGNFTAILIKRARQYYELPSTFSEFGRQCRWIGKGINNIINQKQRNRQKFIWIAKSIFLLFPLIFLWNLKLFLTFLIITLGISYFGLIHRNKNPILSLITLPFLYIKTFLVSFNIIRFWKHRKN